MMGPGEVVVAIVFIITIGEIVKERGKHGGKGGGLKTVLAELRELKDELRQLRQQNTDVVISLDNSVQRLDRRLGHLETRVSLPPGEEREQRC